VAASGLIDTGAILALLDRNDRWHSRCSSAFKELRLPLATSAAVLCEVFHLIGDDQRSRATAWGVLRSGVITVLSIDDGDLPDLEALMKRYADRPMDFADATLVHLARRQRLNLVFTVDHDDFETYRIDGRRRFRVVPGG
jgi:predicted nucleic acid-binding protein